MNCDRNFLKGAKESDVRRDDEKKINEYETMIQEKWWVG